MAITMMLSLNVGNAVHERIRLQSHADAVAFSSATLEARAFNTMAHHNRAIAASMVGFMSLAAYRSVADRVVRELRETARHLELYAERERSLMCPPCHNNPCAATECVAHPNMAMAGAMCFRTRADVVEAQAQGSGFENAVTSMQDMVRRLHADQEGVLGWTYGELNNGSVISELTRRNAPFAEVFGGEASQGAFACSVEGYEAMEDRCQYLDGRPAPRALDSARRDSIMQSVAMAARPPLTAGGNLNGRNMAGRDFTPTAGIAGAPLIVNPSVCQGYLGSWTVQVQDTVAALENGSQSAHAVTRGGTLTTIWPHHTFPPMATQPGAGDFALTRGSQGYEGTPCDDEANCFINFRVSDSAALGFNQPSTYGGAAQPLWQLGRRYKGNYGPWHLGNQPGYVGVRSSWLSWNILLAPQGWGYAAAKGKTYFHQLGQGTHWSVAPNSFDPFWRAKLHPFGRRELYALLRSVGDPSAEVLDSDSPVDGDRMAR